MSTTLILVWFPLPFVMVQSHHASMHVVVYLQVLNEQESALRSTESTALRFLVIQDLRFLPKTIQSVATW